MKNEGHYLTLLQIMVRVAEANARQPVDVEWIYWAEALALKCNYHTISALYLCRHTRLQELKADFIDPVSIGVITRAALESVLTFSYLFTSPNDDKERDFRCDAWMHADLMTRQGFPASSETSQQTLNKDRKQITDLQEKLRVNPCMSSLSPRLKPQSHLHEKRPKIQLFSFLSWIIWS